MTQKKKKQRKEGRGEEGLRYMFGEVGGNPGKGWMITTVHLGCARVTVPMNPRGGKGGFVCQQDKSLDGYESVRPFI